MNGSVFFSPESEGLWIHGNGGEKKESIRKQPPKKNGFRNEDTGCPGILRVGALFGMVKNDPLQRLKICEQ